MNNQWRDNSNKMVVWADGSYDTARSCDQCCGPNCSMPVHQDRYKQVGTTRLEEAEEEAAAGYWDWMGDVKPLGVSRDHDGDLVMPELLAANPDSLEAVEDHNSGTGKQHHSWMREAYDDLTVPQKEVWDLVMREQVSQIDAAERLGVSKQAVFDRLNAAKQSVIEYLRMKQEHGAN